MSRSDKHRDKFLTDSEDEQDAERITNKNQYVKVAKVGTGTYGRVYKVHLKNKPNKYYALKKIVIHSQKQNQGFPLTALREIKLLQNIQHDNIVRLLQIFTSKPSGNNAYRGSTFIVMEYLEHDFEGLLWNQKKFTHGQLKFIIQQILNATYYLHSQNIIHRDLKTANLLYGNNGMTKLADFGLARKQVGGRHFYTNNVVTLWYRSPELLLGQAKYSFAVDMWSIGCIMAEIIIGKPLFKGSKEAQQLQFIYEKCGSPTEEIWPGVTTLPYFRNFGPKQDYKKKINEYMLQFDPKLDQQTLDMLDRLLTLDPAKRITAKEALNHPYFREGAPISKPHEMPTFDKEYHNTLIKEKRKQQKVQQQRANERGDTRYNKQPYNSKPYRSSKKPDSRKYQNSSSYSRNSHRKDNYNNRGRYDNRSRMPKTDQLKKDYPNYSKSSKQKEQKYNPGGLEDLVSSGGDNLTKRGMHGTDMEPKKSKKMKGNQLNSLFSD